MIKTMQDRQPGLGTSSIVGALTLTKTGTTARTATFPDAAIVVSGSAAALTSGRVPYVTTGGLLTDSADLTFSTASGLVAASTLDGAYGIVVRNIDASGVSASARIRVANAVSATSDLEIGAWGASRSGSQFGTTRANAAFLYSTAASITALVIGHTGSSAPVIIGSNNATICTFATTGITAAQPVTVPNGTAGAPGIRLTGEAHGLYRISATSLGLSAAGVLSVSVGRDAALTLGECYLSGSTEAAGRLFTIATTRNDAVVALSGSSGYGNGGQVRVYGQSHGTKPNYVEFTRASTVSAYFDGSGNLSCSGTVTVANGTAAAPGIRATTWASGLWASTASRLNVSISGVTAASIFYDATNGGEIMLVGGTSLQSGIFSSITTGFVYVSGSTGPLAGGQIRVYGSAHATKTNYVEFTRVAAVSAYFDGSGIFTLNNTTDASAIGTAAIVGLGGASIAKSLWVGGTAGNYINIANSTGELRVNGTKVVSAQGAAVTDAAAVAGTATLAGYGFVSAAEFNAYVTATNVIKDQFNALLARCRAHGLIA